MSTSLPGSSSNDFEQCKNTVFMKHTPDSQSSSTWLHRKTEYMTQRKFLEYLQINIVIWPWSESRCPLRYQVYLVTTMNIISGNNE